MQWVKVHESIVPSSCRIGETYVPWKSFLLWMAANQTKPYDFIVQIANILPYQSVSKTHSIHNAFFHWPGSGSAMDRKRVLLSHSVHELWWSVWLVLTCRTSHVGIGQLANIIPNNPHYVLTTLYCKNIMHETMRFLAQKKHVSMHTLRYSPSFNIKNTYIR